MSVKSSRFRLGRLALRLGAVLFVTSVGAILATSHADATTKYGEEYSTRHFGKRNIEQVTVSDVASLTSDASVDGASNLIWTRKGVGFNYNADGLEANAPYTMWWVAFNRPQKCLSPCECGLVDLSDPAVGAGVFFAGGRMSDAAGQASFSGEIGFHELPKGEDQVPFRGVEEPIRWRGAEMHLVVRDHGPALDDPTALKAQLTQFNGGCPPNGCVDVQASIHKSPLCRKRWRR